MLHQNWRCVQKQLYQNKVLNREGRKEIAKDAKKTYECSGLFGKTLEGENLKTERTPRMAAEDPGLLLLPLSLLLVSGNAFRVCGKPVYHRGSETRFEICLLLLLVSGRAVQACRKA